MKYFCDGSNLSSLLKEVLTTLINQFFIFLFFQGILGKVPSAALTRSVGLGQFCVGALLLSVYPGLRTEARDGGCRQTLREVRFLLPWSATALHGQRRLRASAIATP